VAALAAASDGDTLLLRAGQHPGPIEITRRVRLQGEPGAVIQGDGHGVPLTLAADGIEIRGVTVRGSGADLAKDDAVILLREAEGITVADCNIEARAFGIYLQAGGKHRIVDNVIVGDASLKRERRGNGVHLWHTTHNEVRGNRMKTTRDGVYLSFAHDNLIEGNSGSGLRYGIHYMYSERNRLRLNRFSGCTGGIALMYSMNNTIEDNVTENNSQFGILCQQLEHSKLRRNRVTLNGRGFFIENSARNHFERNQIKSNGVGVFSTAGSEQNVFVANRFDSNLVQVFEDRPGNNSFDEAGRGNYWSDYAGFDWNSDGVGETPYRLQTATSALLARRPETRWFWRSPLLALLDWWDARVQLASSSSLDRYPLLGFEVEPAP
jgi:nitrous oxidase accessory protein